MFAETFFTIQDRQIQFLVVNYNLAAKAKENGTTVAVIKENLVS